MAMACLAWSSLGCSQEQEPSPGNDAAVVVFQDAAVSSDGGVQLGDAALPDAAVNDAAVNDAAVNDAAVNDAAVNDAAVNDAGPSDGSLTSP
jgi:hypothetical protein